MSSVVEVFRSAWTSLNLELENQGSVARDHLASERTFLAWLRTSLSLVSIGIAITQIFRIPSLVGPDAKGGSDGYLYVMDEDGGGYATSRRLDGSLHLHNLAKLGKPVGGAFIVLGIIVLLLGCRRYFVVQAQLTRGKFPPSRVSVPLTALLVGALIVAATSVILLGDKKSL